jgi:gluconate 2-dehydrogenase gamma chain
VHVPRVLKPAEWRVIEALTAVILPSDDGVGAREANVVGFIDAQLATEELAPLAPALREMARRIDAYARAHHGRSFSDLAMAEQHTIAVALGQGEPFGDPFPASLVFGALHTLTLEGFLSDPVHGGNLDQVGWRYIDFPEPTLRTPGAHHHHSLPLTK